MDTMPIVLMKFLLLSKRFCYTYSYSVTITYLEFKRALFEFTYCQFIASVAKSPEELVTMQQKYSLNRTPYSVQQLILYFLFNIPRYVRQCQNLWRPNDPVKKPKRQARNFYQFKLTKNTSRLQLTFKFQLNNQILLAKLKFINITQRAKEHVIVFKNISFMS